MTQRFDIHPDNPQQRLIDQAVAVLNNGGVIIYPTDAAYALGCKVGDKGALERIRQLRKLDKHHNFTLMCQDLSQLATYAQVDNSTFRLLKAHTPGPYTFLLTASREVPKRLLHPRRKTIGLRVPDNVVTQQLLATLGEPLMSVTAQLPGHDLQSDPNELYDQWQGRIDALISSGAGSLQLTTVVDVTSDQVEIIRNGLGV